MGDALSVEPLQGRTAGLGQEAAGQGARCPAGVAGEVGDGERIGQVLQRPRAGRCQALPGRGHGTVQPLRLPTVAVRGDDHAPGDAGGGLRAVVGAHQVQAQVDASGQAGTGGHGPVVDPQHVGVHLDVGVPVGELGGVGPVGGEVAGPVDHRSLGHGGARPGWSSGAWIVPGSPAQLTALGLAAPSPADRRQLRVGGHPLWAMAAIEDVVHLHFTELCEAPTSTGDLLELTDRYRTLVLAGVPALSGVSEDARRRFANLVDVCWDRDIRLVVTAAAPAHTALDAAVTDHDRMASRLSLLQRQ